MGDQVVRKVVGLGVSVWLARFLGPRHYGEFSYALAVVTIISPFAMMSLDDLSVRRLTQNPSSRNEVLGTSFYMMLAGGLVAFALGLAAISLVRPGDRLMFWLVGILTASTIVQAFIVIDFWFKSQMEGKFSVYAKTFAFLLLSIIKIGLICLKAPLVAFAWAMLAETALASVGLLIVYRKRGFKVKEWFFSRTMARSLLKDSWPLFSAALLTMAYLRIDQVMLGDMAGSKELGNYSVAVQITEAWFFVPMVICSAVFPALVEAEATSEELFYAHMRKLYNLMVFYGYVVALPVMFFSGEIVQFLFSSAYKDAGPLLSVLIWSSVFGNLAAARGVLILSKNWTRVNLVCIALGFAMNVSLNLLLIPAYGAMGAVVATCISYWFSVHGTCFLFQSLRHAGSMMTRALIYPKIW
jgi:O-antigen/teichoic acid export membrane protein